MDFFNLVLSIVVTVNMVTKPLEVIFGDTKKEWLKPLLLYYL